MKRKLSFILVLFAIFSLVACQIENTKFGIEVKSYEDIEYIYNEDARVSKRNLEDKVKEKIYKMITSLDEDDFEKVNTEPLKGGGPRIQFKLFSIEVSNEHLRIYNEDGIEQYNAKNDISDLKKLLNLLDNELGIQ